MKEIKRLVHFLQRLSGKKILQVIEFIPVSESSPLICHRLLAHVQHGKIDNDDEAAAALYEGANSEDHRYRMLKSRTLHKLNNLILFRAFKGDGDDPENECMADLSRAKIFLQENELELADKQLKSAILIAQQKEFTELALMGLRMLRTVYSSLYRPKKLARVIEEIEVYEELCKAEEEAAKIYYLHHYRINKSMNSRAVHLEKVPEQLERLRQLWLKTGSSNVYVKEFDLRVCYYLHTHQYSALLDYCQQTEALLGKGKINTLRFNFAHLYHALFLSLLKAKSYAAALDYSRNILKEVSLLGGEHDGLAFQEIYFITAIRSKRWELAQQVYAEVLQKLHRRGKIEDVMNWNVLYGYLLLYTNEVGGMASRSFDEMVKNMEELNVEPSLNIRLHVLKIVDLFKSDSIPDFLTLYPKVDQLFRSYRAENLIERERLVMLADFLYQLIALNFEPEAVKRKTKKLLRKLDMTYDPYSPTEVIPFGEVVAFIINHFDKAHQQLHFGKQ